MLTWQVGIDQMYTICSADAIVFRVLGALQMGDQGMSLEEVLQKLGLSHKLERQFGRAFREQRTKQGFAEGIQGFGMKQ